MEETAGDAPPTLVGGNDAPAAADDYNDELDNIVGWTINRKDSKVTLTTKRSADNSQRQVPEELVQRVNERKLIEYWRSFKKPRDVTVKCASYRIFEILAHKPGKTPTLLIHWVGYTADPKDGSASWEPLDNMLRSDEALVLKYLNAHGLTRQLQPKTRGVGAAAANARGRTSTPSAPKPAASKKRGAATAGPPIKRGRRSNAEIAAIAAAIVAAKKKEEGEDEEQPKEEAVPEAKPVVKAGAKSKAAAASTRQARGAAAGGLFRLNLNVSGLKQKDIQRLISLATELTTQNNAATISTIVQGT